MGGDLAARAGSSPPPRASRLTPLQRDLLAAFFRLERRFFLSGGAALAGFHLGHRETEDLDLFSPRAPMLDPDKEVFGDVRVDTLREIAANKVCTLLGRAEIKDLVDLREIIRSGHGLEPALADAESKEGGVDPAALAWVLDQLTISRSARLPGGVDPAELDGFRQSLVARLRAIAFSRARRDPTA